MRMLEWISVIEEIEKGYRLMLVDAEDGEVRFYKSEKSNRKCNIKQH